MNHDNNQLIVEMRGISKIFPGIVANDMVNFELRLGEVHSLLGENGAGKTTLAKVLSGLYEPDTGEIIINGQKTTIRSPHDAIRSGVGMVHQHFRLINNFTVAENITLGLSEPKFRMNMDVINEEVACLSEKYRLKVNPRAYIWQLSIGEQQRVEILKNLYRNARVLIMDEPTAVLTPQEAKELIKSLREMVASGKSIIFVSHKLQEVMEVSDRITVLRAGKNVTTLNKEATNPKELGALMVGKEISYSASKTKSDHKEIRLEVKDLHVMGDRGLPTVKGVSLTIRKGEILGIAGISGNGQRELAEVLAGLRKAESGTLKVDGIDLTNATSLQKINVGVSLVPEDRLGMGLIPSLDVYENIMLKSFRKSPISYGPFLRMSEVRRNACKLVESYAVKAPKMDAPVKKLSGGNQQRLLLAREISSNPKIIIASQPIRGIDVQAIMEIHRLLLEQRNNGVAILLISDDLDEVFEVSDRIAVIYEGQIVGEMNIEEADKEKIGLMMAGYCQTGEESACV